MSNRGPAAGTMPGDVTVVEGGGDTGGFVIPSAVPIRWVVEVAVGDPSRDRSLLVPYVHGRPMYKG